MSPGRASHADLPSPPAVRSELAETICARIRASGPVTFRWFMEQALYDPAHGYYAAGRATIGRRGDYLTNVSVGALFGRLLCRQFAEMWARLGEPADVTLVEQGAHDGQFAADVLAAAGEVAPEMAAALRYVIVEPFAPLEARQRERLAAFPRVSWRHALGEVAPFEGVHFSNELLDAMPVHLVRFTGGEWRERYVECGADGFVFVDGPLSSAAVHAHLARVVPPQIEGYTTELHLDALAWVGELAGALRRGYALVVDYGYPRDVFYSAERREGTLVCYSRHQRSFLPLAAPGEIDLTAHVEFTGFAEAALAHGLALAGFADQHHFMVGLGREEFPDTVASGARAAPDAKALRAFRTLMHPTLMGRSFHFLALARDAPAAPPLAGFAFAPDARTTLGLAT